MVWDDCSGSIAPHKGGQDHLRHDAIGLPAVHEAWQPLLIARVEEITDVRGADEARGVPIPCSMVATLSA